MDVGTRRIWAICNGKSEANAQNAISDADF